MHEITVPQLNSNDAGYVLTTWHYADGDTVPAGAEIAVVETSKTAEELTACTGGVLQRRLAESQECRPGEVIGRLFADEPARQQFLATQVDAGRADATQVGAPPSACASAGLIITAPARELIDRNGIDLAALSAIGKKVIRSADVQRLVVHGGRRVHRLGPAQLAIAEVVTASHRTIPAAYAVVSVTVDQAHPGNPGLPALLIRCVADLHDRYPLFFAAAGDDGTASVAEEARVGVTIDIGHGLTIPVIGGADLASVTTIAAALTALRGKALRQRLTAADLADATIAISLPAGDVLLAQPIVPLGLSCMLALGATHTVPDLDADGALIHRRTVYLGLSYDHRLINGRDAALFLGEIKAALQSPARLHPPLGGAP
jgi:2-oxoglutarate dehydrogenase E2 component (dihydrolipoamide succinyltransferase)